MMKRSNFRSVYSLFTSANKNFTFIYSPGHFTKITSTANWQTLAKEDFGNSPVFHFFKFKRPEINRRNLIIFWIFVRTLFDPFGQGSFFPMDPSVSSFDDARTRFNSHGNSSGEHSSTSHSQKSEFDVYTDLREPLAQHQKLFFHHTSRIWELISPILFFIVISYGAYQLGVVLCPPEDATWEETRQSFFMFMGVTALYSWLWAFLMALAGLADFASEPNSSLASADNPSSLESANKESTSFSVSSYHHKVFVVWAVSSLTVSAVLIIVRIFSS